jgi:hypothetical protein
MANEGAQTEIVVSTQNKQVAKNDERCRPLLMTAHAHLDTTQMATFL